MQKFGFLVLALALILSWGCAKKTVSSEAPQKQEQPAEEVVVVEEEKVVVVEETPAPTPMEIYEQTYGSLPRAHTVVKGECLWWIAEYPQIFNDPFMWPLVYKSNRDQIKNPNLIYPGQVLNIPRSGMTLAEIKDARKQAGAPWKALDPAATANLPSNIRQELGYGF